MLAVVLTFISALQVTELMIAPAGSVAATLKPPNLEDTVVFFAAIVVVA